MPYVNGTEPRIAPRLPLAAPASPTQAAARPWAGDNFEAVDPARAPRNGALVDGPSAGGDVPRTLRLPKDYDGPILVCDIDGTLRDTSVVDLAIGETQPPIPGAREMLAGLAARGVPIIYLSAGPDLIHNRNDKFLAQLPEGILLDKPGLSPLELLMGAKGKAELLGEFKDEVIGRLKVAFPKAQLVGLGDDAQGDAIAYTSDGVDAFIHDIRPQHDTIPADFHGTLSTTYDDAYRGKLFADVDAMISRSASFQTKPSKEDDAATKLSAVLDETTGTRASSVTGLELLVDGDAAYPALLKSLDDAKTSICYDTFNFFDDPVGNEVVDHLIAAKKRGVAVRVVVDAFGAREIVGHENKALARLRQAGVEVHDFNPLDSLSDLLDIHREHRKTAIIDGTTAYVGGMNTAIEFMGPSGTPGRMHDVMVRFGGACVADVVAAFADSWNASGGAALDLATLGAPQVSSAAMGVTARVLAHMPNDDQKIRAAYLAMIDSAQKTIDVENSYPMEDDLVDALVAAAERGVSVRYVVGSSEGALGSEAKERYRRLLAAGVKIFQYPTKVHTKALAVDGIAVSVGSSNVDTMSLSQDREIVLLVEDAAFTQRFTQAVFSKDVAASKEIKDADLKGFWGGLGRFFLNAIWPTRDE